ncbi:autotransporter assembly complex protein TamA [Piscinibacter sp.]|uniref:autotransporter assembly complex protein TamA n=1 Tax=Piscinibacter sp. TaxID=1903157 RepID=UPI002BE70429|nr:BamA/TamA family outer membrane protein [Albitalea sp.]HUG21705.1 BamA/TamA family outer membrane protein [Albitalea sp.]
MRLMNVLPPARCVRLLICSACLLLGGCALLQKDDDDGGDKPEAASPLRLEVVAPDELEDLLEMHLDLARLPVLAAGAPIPDSELARLIAAAPAQARSLLETEGYFNAEVNAQRLPGEPPGVRIEVQPGPRTHVAEVSLAVRGPLAEATRRDESYARDAQRALRHEWPLPPGSPFRNPVWSSAKRTALAQLRAQAYVEADWLSTTARVDASTQQADLDLTVDSGPLFRTGELRIQGLEDHDEQTVRNVANFKPGTPATERLLLDYQERLQNTGLFDRATVLVNPEAADPAAAPIDVQLSERQMQQATFGIGISADVGVRGTVEHVHRRVFGHAATGRNRFELGGLRQSWEGELSTHTLPGLYRNLVGGAAERIESDDDVVTSSRLRVGRAQDTQRIDRLLFVEVERSLRRTATTRETADSVAVHHHGVWRKVDDVMLPTEGYVLALQNGIGQARSDPGGSGPFFRSYGRLNGYWPVGSWYSQARLELGQVFVRDDVTVPETLRFRAGGEHSVRGYAYRSLGPIVDGVVTSGNVLFTASAEIARPLLKRLPELWGAVFIDAGRAADHWNDLKPAVGVGVGARYRSPIGPVALDLAWGEEVKKFRMHLSVGVTF